MFAVCTYVNEEGIEEIVYQEDTYQAATKLESMCESPKISPSLPVLSVFSKL